MSKNSRVKVSSFPGCTTLDVKDHIKPLLRRNPDEIIIHVGTNSLRSCDTPSTCAEEIIDLATMASSKSSAKIALSILVCRSDNEALACKISGVNKVLEESCRQNSWGFVDHSNIFRQLPLESQWSSSKQIWNITSCPEFYKLFAFRLGYCRLGIRFA